MVEEDVKMVKGIREAKWNKPVPASVPVCRWKHDRYQNGLILPASGTGQWTGLHKNGTQAGTGTLLLIPSKVSYRVASAQLFDTSRYRRTPPHTGQGSFRVAYAQRIQPGTKKY